MQNERSKQIAEMQELQTKMQALVVERQQLMMQQNDIDRALKSLKDVDGKTYEMIGTLLVERKKEDIEKDMLERKQLIEVRLESIEKNERVLRSRLQSLAEKLQSQGGAGGG